MRASKLRQRVTIKASVLRQRIKVFAKTSGRSSTGAPLPAVWTLTHTLWASFEPLSVKDVLAAQAANSEITARCQLRYRTDIDSTMQIEYRGQRYEIDGDPLHDSRTGFEYMTLMLKSKSG